MFKKILTLITVAAFAALIGCASGANSKAETKPTESTVVKLKLTPVSGKVAVGSTMQFSVIGVDAKDKPVVIIANWKLTGSKTVIGTIDTVKGEKVTFTAKAPGTVTLEAEYNNLKASAAIEVVKKK